MLLIENVASASVVYSAFSKGFEKPGQVKDKRRRGSSMKGQTVYNSWHVSGNHVLKQEKIHLRPDAGPDHSLDPSAVAWNLSRNDLSVFQDVIL